MKFYRCPAKGQGRCGSVSRLAAPVNACIKAQELDGLEARINESTRRYEAGEYSAERYWPSLARMEAREAELKRERRQYEGRQQQRRHAVANLAEEWDKPDFTMEQKQAAIAETLAAVIIKPMGRGIPFHPDHIVPVFRGKRHARIIRPA